MTDNKVLMVKLFTGDFVNEGKGKGREQFNINENAIIDGKYYGVILNSGEFHNLSLEQIDDSANKKTDVIHGITLIYFMEINDVTCIVAIAENTTVFRKIQNDDYIRCQRKHIFNLTGEEEKVGFHTITEAENMHLLNENFIPIAIPKECRYFFRAHRALSKAEKYFELRQQIINKVTSYLYDSEIDLLPYEVENAEVDNGNDGSKEPISILDSPTGSKINKKPKVSKTALHNAQYNCEYDPSHHTFLTSKNLPYMEGHHLIRCTVALSKTYKKEFDCNIDSVPNIACLCPTCHRRIHYGSAEEKAEIITRLFEKKKSGLHDAGIIITLDELMAIYI